MSSSAKMRKLSVRIDADLKASFEDTLRGIGVDPTCAMRSFAFQIVLEGDIPLGPVDAGFEAGGGTAVTSVKIPAHRRRRDGVRAQGPGHELLAGREAARAADGRAGRDAVRRRHLTGGETRGRRPPGGLWALFLGEAPFHFGAPRRPVADANAVRT